MVEYWISYAQPGRTVAVCVLGSALLLAGAHLFERLGNMPPCILCLDQREAHWAALAAGGLTLLLTRVTERPGRFLAAALGALSLIYFFSAALAAYHAGVEWGLWPGPQSCAVSADFSMATGMEILGSLAEAAPGPSCSEAAWRMFGISMAGYNAVISLALGSLAVLSCLRTARGLRQDRVRAAALVH